MSLRFGEAGAAQLRHAWCADFIVGEKHGKVNERNQRETEGITLAKLETNDLTKHTYYHFTSEGQKAQDWMWFVRKRLRELMMEVPAAPQACSPTFAALSTCG